MMVRFPDVHIHLRFELRASLQIIMQRGLLQFCHIPYHSLPEFPDKNYIAIY